MPASKKTRSTRDLLAQQLALIAAEEFALSVVPLLIAVNEAGGMAAAIKILKAAKKVE